MILFDAVQSCGALVSSFFDTTSDRDKYVPRAQLVGAYIAIINVGCETIEFDEVLAGNRTHFGIVIIEYLQLYLYFAMWVEPKAVDQKRGKQAFLQMEE